MRIAAAGSFAQEVAGALAAALVGSAAERSRSVVAILDAFDPAEAARLQAGDEAEPLLLCFLTVRGLFVSRWLDPSGPCLVCFSRRWHANLAFWEHEPEQERRLQALERHRPGVRSFPVPPTAVALARALILDRLGGRDEQLCSYVDLISAEGVVGRLIAVDDCAGCRSQMEAPCRYTHGLEALADRLAL